MKKWFIIFFAVMVLFASCNLNKAEDTTAISTTGTFVGRDGTFIFNSDGTMQFGTGTDIYKGTWSLKDESKTAIKSLKATEIWRYNTSGILVKRADMAVSYDLIGMNTEFALYDWSFTSKGFVKWLMGLEYIIYYRQ